MDKPEMPVFVKIDEYDDILNVINLIKNKIDQAKNLLGKIDELKNEEDAELDLWKANLEEVEKRVNSINNSLFEPESV